MEYYSHYDRDYIEERFHIQMMDHSSLDEEIHPLDWEESKEELKRMMKMKL